MAKDYFLNVSDAYKEAFKSVNGGGKTELAEQRLASIGILPAGRIKGQRGDQVVYRPFYDPDDIAKKRDDLSEIDKQIKELQEKRSNLLSGNTAA